MLADTDDDDMDIVPQLVRQVSDSESDSDSDDEDEPEFENAAGTQDSDEENAQVQEVPSRLLSELTRLDVSYNPEAKARLEELTGRESAK